MTPKLYWVTVRLALIGVSEGQSSKAVAGLQNELNMRPHLKNAQVSWEAGSRRVIVQVDDEGLDANSVSKGMAEELLEIVSAVFVKPSGIRVEILGAETRPPDTG